MLFKTDTSVVQLQIKLSQVNSLTIYIHPPSEFKITKDRTWFHVSILGTSDRTAVEIYASNIKNS